jgi:hypothetical protein
MYSTWSDGPPASNVPSLQPAVLPSSNSFEPGGWWEHPAINSIAAMQAARASISIPVP